MNVLSLFDGMACGLQALKQAGIPVTNYYASEIDKYAIQVAKKNHAEIQHLGSISDWKTWQLPNIDLIIGGSPCQGFSFAGKQLAFDDPRSRLIFDFVDCLRHLKPTYFLLENVKMKKEHLQIITDLVGVSPIKIDSALVSAQRRVRYYWTNIPNVTQPDDLGILLKDIILENTNQLELSHTHVQHIVKKINKYCTVDPHKASTMTARQYASWNGTYTIEALAKYKVPLDKTLQIMDKEVSKGKIKQIKGKTPSDTIYYIHNTEVKPESPQIKEPYLFGVITPDRVNKRQNGQRFSDSTKFYTLTAQDKHGILTEGYIRKLTPVECERLQTLPDTYTEGVSDTQRYKMLGNGWTVKVITHIFSGLAQTT